MSLIEQAIAHRAKLFAAIEATEKKQAEVVDEFETSVKIATAEYKRSNDKLVSDLKAFIAEEYGEPTESEIAAVVGAGPESSEITVDVAME